MGCLKCKSPDHMERDCPDVTKDEGVALLKGHANALAAERAQGLPAAQSGVKRVTTAANEPREGLQADLSVASGGLVSSLIASGVPVELLNTAPVNLQPYGASSEPIRVAKQVLLRKLEFKTACGPLMLRGLRVWVDESVQAMELILGLPVMKKLGYSDQTIAGKRETPTSRLGFWRSTDLNAWFGNAQDSTRKGTL
ncbi:unnamed protein product [Aphanomyces euteiches]